MFKLVRITILLTILVMVAAGSWVTRAISTDWQRTLWVNVHPINGDGSPVTARYIERLQEKDFAQVVSFIERETERYGQKSSEPIRMFLARAVSELPPATPFEGNVFKRIGWSLKMRFWSKRVTGDDSAPTPDVRMFVVYHDATDTMALDRSVGVQKGMFGVVNAYAAREYSGSNQLIIAHELLHTLGATDKYDPASGVPIAPDGLANPQQIPLFPQLATEIMGGRRALGPDEAEMPRSLKNVVIGPKTADEIRLSVAP